MIVSLLQNSGLTNSVATSTILIKESLGAQSVAAGCDGDFFIACGKPNNKSVLCRYIDNKVNNSFEINTKGVVRIFPLSNKKEIIVVTQEGKIFNVQIDKFEKCNILISADVRVNDVAVSQDESRIALATEQGDILIYDLAGKKLLKKCKLKDSIPISLCFSRNDMQLYSGHRNGAIIIWNVADWSVHKKLLAHDEGVSFLLVADNRDFFISGSRDSLVKSWSAQYFARISTWNLGNLEPVAAKYVTCSEHIAIGCMSGELVLLSTSLKATIAEIKLHAHTYPLTTVAYSSQLKTIITGSIIDEQLIAWRKWPK